MSETKNAPTTIIVPFTTSRGDELYPFEVLVPAGESPQIRTVSIEHRITEMIGSVPDARMDDVDTALEYSLSLREL